jgi:SAM-dependent methyltransferase
MHVQAREFTIFVKSILIEFFVNKCVLDVGSGDINGNNRFLFENCEYVGNDVIQAPNVTIVSKTKDLPFCDGFFDTVVSSECFEHDPEYKESLLKIYELLKPDGLFFFTCASTGRAEHGTKRTTPHDSYGTIGNLTDMSDYYKNLSEFDLNDVLNLNTLFSGWNTYYNSQSHDLYFVGIKKNKNKVSKNIELYSNRYVTHTSNNIRVGLQKQLKQHIIPDVTIVTACFCTYENNHNALTIENIIERSEEILKVPCYLVIYGDDKTIPIIAEKRRLNGFTYLTTFITTTISDLWTHQYKDSVVKNRNEFWGTKDNRAQTDSHLINCNKCDFMLQTINTNPFNTSKFCWMDCFLNINATKICEDYNVSKLMYVLTNITDKFHIQVLNVTDKKYKLDELKREYYSEYRWVMCGCFYTCGKEIGKKVFNRLKELFITTTHQGYGHGDEMLHLEILDEFYDDIVRSYGDYNVLLNNFIEPTKNYNYIYNNILNKYLNYGYNKECYDCSVILLKQIETHKIQVDYSLYLQILSANYISSYYHCPEKSIHIVNHIYDICKSNPYMNLEFEKNYHYYLTQFNYANKFKEHHRIIICVFACATIPKFKDEILKIEQTWGKYSTQKGIKVLYFLGEEQTDLQDASKYIYLDGVKNDYNSAGDKQNLGLKYIYENYNADFVFVCGTDTYINVENLLILLNEYNCESPLYIGGHGDTRTVCEKSCYYHSGGAGFVLSNECLHLIYRKLWSMSRDWKFDLNEYNSNWLTFACDLEISYYLQKFIPSLQIIVNDDVFFSCDHNGLINDISMCCGEHVKKEQIVSCHRMTLHSFDEFTQLLQANNYYLI